MPPLNGHDGLPPRSHTEIWLERIHRDLAHLNDRVGLARQETAELRGEVRHGMRTLAVNDRELFEQMRAVRDRVTTIEARPPSAGPPHTAPAGLSRGTRIRASLPDWREMLLVLAVLAVAALIAPERTPSVSVALPGAKLSVP